MCMPPDAAANVAVIDEASSRIRIDWPRDDERRGAVSLAVGEMPAAQYFCAANKRSGLCG